MSNKTDIATIVAGVRQFIAESNAREVSARKFKGSDQKRTMPRRSEIWIVDLGLDQK